MDKFQRLCGLAYARRCALGEHTACSSAKSLAASDDATAVAKNKQFKPAVCANSAGGDTIFEPKKVVIWRVW